MWQIHTHTSRLHEMSKLTSHDNLAKQNVHVMPDRLPKWCKNNVI